MTIPRFLCIPIFAGWMLFEGLQALGDEPKSPAPSVVVPLHEFDGRPIRVLVSHGVHPVRSVRWAVGNLYKTADGKNVPSDADLKVMASTDRLIEHGESQGLGVIAADLRALRDKYAASFAESPDWLSWNHKPDPRESVSVVWYRERYADGEEDLEVGVSVTVRRYGKQLLAELQPYHTEFRERARRRGEREPITFLGTPYKLGELVHIPLDDLRLQARSQQKFVDQDQLKDRDHDETAHDRELARSVRVGTTIAQLSLGIPIRFYVGDEVLPAHIESESPTSEKYHAALLVLKQEEERLRELTTEYEVVQEEIQAVVCKENLGLSPKEVVSEFEELRAKIRRLGAEKKSVAREKDIRQREAHAKNVAALQVQHATAKKRADQVIELLSRISVAGSIEQKRAVELIGARPESRRLAEQAQRVENARLAVEEARSRP